MQTKKNFFQVRILFTFFLMFFCSPVFSLNSKDNTDKFVASLSSTFHNDPSLAIDKCFDDNRDTICATENDGYLEINFDGDFDLTNFIIYNRTNCCQDRLSHFIVNDLTDRTFNLNSDLIQTFGLQNVTNIKIYPKNSQLLNLSEVSFVFVPVSVDDNNNDNNNDNTDNQISQGVNWSLFSYSFTIVAVLFLFGRGIKTVLDLVKYG